MQFKFSALKQSQTAEKAYNAEDISPVCPHNIHLTSHTPLALFFINVINLKHIDRAILGRHVSWRFFVDPGFLFIPQTAKNDYFLVWQIHPDVTFSQIMKCKDYPS